MGFQWWATRLGSAETPQNFPFLRRSARRGALGPRPLAVASAPAATATFVPAAFVRPSEAAVAEIGAAGREGADVLGEVSEERAERSHLRWPAAGCHATHHVATPPVRAAHLDPERQEQLTGFL